MPNTVIKFMHVLSGNGKEMIILQRLDLAEHDIVPPVVELHRVVVAHGVVAAEVNTLLKKYVLPTMLTNVVFYLRY